MLVQIDSVGMGRIGFTFDNGVRLSVIFNDMSYSDNYDLWKRDGITDFDRMKKQGYVNSKTVEIMQTDGNPALNGWISKKYGSYYSKDDPIAYVPVEHLPAILKRADSRVYQVKRLVDGTPRSCEHSTSQRTSPTTPVNLNQESE